MTRKIGFIDLRKEIETLASHVGFRWLVLRKVDLTLPCTECKTRVPANYDQVPSACKSCMGIGFAFSDEILRGFRYLSNPGFDFLSQVALINTQSLVFILEHDKAPKDTDYLLEVVLDESTGDIIIPPKISRIYKIQDSLPMRGGQPGPVGRIEFYRCSVEERNFGVSSNKT